VAPTPLLAAAEDQAREIFRRAGVETVWLNCSPKLEKVEPRSCYFSDSTHLTLKIIPHAMNAQVRNRIDVLGTAYPDEQGAGYFAYVFYDRIQELAQRLRLGHALLADVMAHEIGHLLLGSTSHSAVESCARIGIMKDLGMSPKELCRSFQPNRGSFWIGCVFTRVSERIWRQLWRTRALRFCIKP
jgi:hypothetical protein